MRFILQAGLGLLLLMPLSGCTGGLNGTDSTTSFMPTCPNWTKGAFPIFSVADTTLFSGTAGQTNKTSVNHIPDPGQGPSRAPPDEGGKRADRYVLDFPIPDSYRIHVENGTLEFRAYRNDTGQQLRLYDVANPQDARLAWTFPAGYNGGAHLQVDLTAPTQEPSPAPLRLEATFTANPGYIVGTGREGPMSRAGATFSLEAYVYYRAAGCKAA